MASNAHASFGRLMGYVEQLVQIHARLQQGAGRRHQQDALHRAGVVLTVAAWEAYTEQVVVEAFTAIDAQQFAAGAATWARSTFTLYRQVANRKAAELHTPNAENVQRLFIDSIGFDPLPHWSWVAPQRHWNAQEMRERMNCWLRIRHGVAHGGGLPANIAWLQGPNGQPRLTLGLLRQCAQFFTRVVDQTDHAFGAYLVATFGLAAPW